MSTSYKSYSTMASKGTQQRMSTQGKMSVRKISDAVSGYELPDVQQISLIHGLPVGTLHVIDEHNPTGTVMVQTVDDVSLPQTVAFLHSSVWAMVNGKLLMVTRGMSYPVDLVTSSVSISDEGTEYTLSNGEVILEVDSRFTSIGVEGFYVRLARFRGYDLFMTRRKIDGLKSNWGSANMFSEYSKVGGPSFYDLFEDTHTSPFVYNFTITTQRSVTGTRQILSSENAGYVTLLGVERSWDQGVVFPVEVDSPSNLGNDREYGGSIAHPRFVETFVSDDTLSNYPEFENDEDPLKVLPLKFRRLRSIPYELFSGKVDKPLGVIAPVCIHLKQVNDFLQWGYYGEISNCVSDPRVQTGETITIFADCKMYRLTHTSFAWRNSLRRSDDGQSGEPHIVRPFYSTVWSNFRSQENFDEKFPSVEVLSIDSIKKEYISTGEPFVWTPGKNQSDIFERNATNIWERRAISCSLFILSLPPHQQAEAVELWEQLEWNIGRLTKFIIGLQKSSIVYLDTSEKSRQVKRLSSQISSKIEAERQGYTVGKGEGFYYRFDNVRISPNNYWALTKSSGPHPTAMKIAQDALNEATKRSQASHGDQKRNLKKWNEKAISRALDNTQFNKIQQMIRQLDAVQPEFFM